MPVDVFFSTEKIDTYARAIESTGKLKDSAARLLTYKGLAERDDRELATGFGRFVRTHAHKLVVAPGAVGVPLLVFSPFNVVGMIAASVAVAAFVTDNVMTLFGTGRVLSLQFKARDNMKREEVAADYSAMQSSRKFEDVMEAFPGIKARFEDAAQREQALNNGAAPVSDVAPAKPAQPTAR